jgi:hypothetical protein
MLVVLWGSFKLCDDSRLYNPRMVGTNAAQIRPGMVIIKSKSRTTVLTHLL